MVKPPAEIMVICLCIFVCNYINVHTGGQTLVQLFNNNTSWDREQVNGIDPPAGFVFIVHFSLLFLSTLVTVVM